MKLKCLSIIMELSILIPPTILFKIIFTGFSLIKKLYIFYLRKQKYNKENIDHLYTYPTETSTVKMLAQFPLVFKK